MDLEQWLSEKRAVQNIIRLKTCEAPQHEFVDMPSEDPNAPKQVRCVYCGGIVMPKDG